MTESNISRRHFLGRVTKTGLTLVGAGAVLSACKRDSNAQDTPKAKDATTNEKGVQCDIAKLSEGEQKTRTSMKYVDQTPIPSKRCDNRKLFVPGKPCGGCTIVKGPIKPEGYCVAWVKA